MLLSECSISVCALRDFRLATTDELSIYSSTADSMLIVSTNLLPHLQSVDHRQRPNKGRDLPTSLQLNQSGVP